MKFVIIFIQIIILYGFYLAGESIRTIFHLPLPGSIIGFLLLFAALMLKIYPLRWIESGAHFLLAFLSLYFIPATVGAIEYGNVFTGKGVWLIAIVLVSTLLTMAVSGLSSQWASRAADQRRNR
ncbi:CidA/LrgA family protein [Planomicrobium sp. CPCC 101110]|uniref:CidA/LrgA family protein n=1 Tax=Planomicrobium sp. CPCC 101110 TaxID=2599619 RepID=UPI0011B68A51|nr:CidA/LrgA family holin-like protein [Planomicrobium sp. CPCC 101110]TWT24894.1 CidA/LrgA family holin-like protein [Planomicrobium sp. CPCC 101110]